MVVLASVIVPMLLYPEQLTTAEPSIPATAYTFVNSLSAVTVAITDILAVANIHTLLSAVTVAPDCTEAEANISTLLSATTTALDEMAAEANIATLLLALTLAVQVIAAEPFNIAMLSPLLC